MSVYRVSKANRQLLASTAIAILIISLTPSANLAVEYVIDDTTSAQNGGNTINAGDSLTILDTGVINMNTVITDAVYSTGGSVTINNYGAINALSSNSRGIVVLNSLNVVNNYGTINSFLDDSDAIAAPHDNNIINNFGTIVTLGRSSDGIDAASNDTIVNSGTINTSGRFSEGITANDANNITNTGTIVTAGERAEGIYVVDGNTIKNSGTITTLGEQAEGIDVNENNIVENSGAITTKGENSEGIYAGANNKITNIGTIKTEGLYSQGIYIWGGADSVVTNIGNIVTVGNSSIGIEIDASGTPTNPNIVVNSGNISTSGEWSTGIWTGGDSVISNSGAIIVTGANANGYYAESGNVFTNTGKIISTQANAINLEYYDYTLNLLAPSFIGGGIFLGNNAAPGPGRDVRVNITTGRSQSVLWDFSNYTTDANVIMNFGGDVPWAWNAATEQFATIDPTALSAAPDMLADMAGSLSDVARNNADDNSWWLSGFGSWSGYDANGIYNDYYNYGGGIVGGISSTVSNGFSLGAMGGYGINKLTVNSKWEISQTIEAKGVVGGIYGNVELDNFFANFSIFGGAMGNDSSRLVNDNLATNSAGETWGIDYANANYNSWFISPELRIGTEIETDGEWTLSPSAMIRYTSQAIDGYTETGSNSNATIGARTVQLLEGNLELAASKPLENGTLTLAGGLDYRQALGAARQNVTLLGQVLAIPLDNSAQIIGYASANASYQIGGNVMLDLSAKASFGTNGYKSVAGSIGINGKF
ncbi:MAG: autotransporter domain-containing protein [Devosiaceae bacterium]|nr:autotransporter domain-containing protein [Devosiaceae bacterium]